MLTYIIVRGFGSLGTCSAPSPSATSCSYMSSSAPCVLSSSSPSATSKLKSQALLPGSSSTERTPAHNGRQLRTDASSQRNRAQHIKILRGCIVVLSVVIQSFSHSFISFIRSFVRHSGIQPFVHFVHSFIRSLIRLFVDFSSIHSCIFVRCRFVDSFVYSFRCLFVVYCFVYVFVYSFMYSQINH